MLRTRVIPILLLKNSGLVKGIKFRKHRYIGDPINAVKIFNEKEVDELVFLDISATYTNRGPNYDVIQSIASEAFMPFAYGGGISEVGQVEKLFKLGVEKVVINTAAFLNPSLIRNASSIAGSQSVVVSMDVKRNFLGNYEVYVENASRGTKFDPVEYAVRMRELGAGEIIVCSIDHEGTGKGFDLKLLELVSNAVDIPVVASGGAGSLQHFAEVVNKTRVAALSAGSMFVFHGKHKAVLITYPLYSKLEELFE